ncbi:MAG: site-2 protease family protein [Anaerolineae bacterium]
MLVRGAIEPADARPVGPVAIYGLASGAISATASSGYWYPVLQLMGILSAALAITNLLPIPALDGGRLLFILIEKIRGRRVDPNWEGAIHLAGMVILLGLMGHHHISGHRIANSIARLAGSAKPVTAGDAPPWARPDAGFPTSGHAIRG